MACGDLEKIWGTLVSWFYWMEVKYWTRIIESRILNFQKKNINYMIIEKR